MGIRGEEVNFEFSRLNSCRNPSISIGIPQNAEALHLALPFDKLRAGFRCAPSRSVQDDKNYFPFFGTAEPGASENVGADAELFATAREMLQA